MASYFDKSGGIFLVEDPTMGIKFQCWPDSIEDQKSVNWSSIDVIGRAEPIPIYRGSSYQTLRFELMFAASIDQADSGNIKLVINKVNFLKSLAYPQVAKNGVSTTPPLVWVIFGETIMSRCVLQGIRVDYNGPWNISTVPPNSGLVSEGIINPIELLDPEQTEANPFVDYPLTAKVELEFMVVQNAQLTHTTVRSSGDKSSGNDKVSFTKRNKLKLRFIDNL